MNNYSVFGSFLRNNELENFNDYLLIWKSERIISWKSFYSVCQKSDQIRDENNSIINLQNDTFVINKLYFAYLAGKGWSDGERVSSLKLS